MSYWPESVFSELKPLKHVCRVNPEALPENTNPDFEFNYIDIGNVTLEKGVSETERMRFEDAPSRARKPVRYGDVIVSTVRTYLRAVAGIGAGADDWVVSTGFAVLRPRDEADPRFLLRVIQSTPFIESVVTSSTGVSYPAINPSTLGDLPVPLPDRETQKAIADFLDFETARIDQLIEKKQRLVGLLAERFEATISNLTSPPHEQSTDWVERPIKALCDIFGRIGFRGYTTEDIVDEGNGAITLSPSNIKDGRMALGERTYLSWRKYHESPEIQIFSGDIVFVKTGSTIGKVAKVDEVPEPMTLNPQLVVLKNIVPDRDFLLFAMQSKAFQYQVSFNRFGGSTPAMSQGNLGRLRVWLPQTEGEQRHRANEILQERRQIETMKELLGSTINRLHEFRSALITAAVTGQIDAATWGKHGQTDRRLEEIEEAIQA